jgi:hypothetical protein
LTLQEFVAGILKIEILLLRIIRRPMCSISSTAKSGNK